MEPMPLYTWQYMPLNADTPITSRPPFLAIGLASVLLLVLAAGGIWSMGQVFMVPSAVPAYMAVEDKDHSPSLSSSTHAPQLRISSSGPIWREITESQRIILMPLRDRWESMGALAKRRWLVLADHYPKMGESERNKLVSRMYTWANLSGQQRNQARLNFESTKRLSAQELQAKWDEYQALSEAEKKRLAEARQAKTAKKSKRRLAVPKAEVQQPVTPSTTAPTALVETQPVSTPQAIPSVQLGPLNHAHPAPIVSSQPIAVPQSMPRVDLPPLPSPTSNLDTHQPATPAPHAPSASQ